MEHSINTHKRLSRELIIMFGFKHDGLQCQSADKTFWNPKINISGVIFEMWQQLELWLENAKHRKMKL